MKKQRSSRQRFTALLLALSLLTLTACSGNSASTASSSDPSSSTSSGASEVVGEVRDQIFLADKIETGIARNADTIGWLNIPNTTIDDAVLQKANRDLTHQENNDYYLRLDEDKKYSLFGCYFADAYSNIGAREELSRNTVIYGHSDYKDEGTGKAPKFTQLFKYNDLEFLQQNPYVYFSSEQEDMVWQIFSVFYTHTDFNYIQTNPSDAQYEELLTEAKARSEFIIDVPVTKEDKILTLSTCSGLYVPGDKINYRYVVMAKLVPGTQVSTDPLKASKNPTPKDSRVVAK